MEVHRYNPSVSFAASSPYTGEPLPRPPAHHGMIPSGSGNNFFNRREAAQSSFIIPGPYHVPTRLISYILYLISYISYLPLWIVHFPLPIVHFFFSFPHWGKGRKRAEKPPLFFMVFLHILQFTMGFPYCIMKPYGLHEPG